ncbi:MAG: inositol monophosphatase [Verrucomicrobiales bacterium]|nr:inositol monophosphatase [Verrucomicrobiales bacterium]|tara:strand:- start:8460 stop:9266 length:807 start_codon:yes stop_codon:yes gene_type:complete
MTSRQIKSALNTALKAARGSGALMRKHLSKTKNINSATQFDIKLELDVRSQKLIEKTLRQDFPEIPILGEEGILGDPDSEYRWVVDPIDGTVNFAYGIPHSCVCIALQQKRRGRAKKGDIYGAETLLGITCDPFLDEMWTAIKDQPTRCNGKKVQVSDRRKLEETIITMGFSKKAKNISENLPTLNNLMPRVRKVRMFGSAGLSMAWIAGGRIDAYLEAGVRIWDVAAGSLLITNAGGEFWHQNVEGHYAVEMISTNGKLRRPIQRCS